MLPGIDAALANIDQERKMLRRKFDHDMAKLDRDERALLGLKTEEDDDWPSHGRVVR